MTAEVWGRWGFMQYPLLAGRFCLFALEFVEGNTITRVYFCDCAGLPTTR